MVFTVGQILTAAQLNANLSANLNYLRSNATNSVMTSETTASTTFTDLATVGPAVTVTTDVQAIVTVYAAISGSTGMALMGFAVSGASTLGASDPSAVSCPNNGVQIFNSAVFLVTGLTPGSNTFTAKYRTGAGTGTFINRRITVIPS